jgi:hypothetical protein
MTFRPELDPDTAERLLSGSLAPDDAPPGFAAVAALLADARPAPDAAVVERDLDALVGAIGTQPDRAGRLNPRRSPMLTHLVTAKVAAIVGAVVLGVGGVAAAGALPAPAQDAAHSVLDHVGVTVPGPDDSSSAEHPGTHDTGSQDNNHASNPACDATPGASQPSVAAATGQQCTDPAPNATDTTENQTGDNQTGQVDQSGDNKSGDNQTGEVDQSGDNQSGDNQTGQVDQSGDNQDQQNANHSQSDSTTSTPANPTGDSRHGGDQTNQSDSQSHGDQGGGGQQGSGN